MGDIFSLTTGKRMDTRNILVFPARVTQEHCWMLCLDTKPQVAGLTLSLALALLKKSNLVPRDGLLVSVPHKSLQQGRTPHIPAMAIGLTDHVWSYREYIWLLVHTDPVVIKQMDERIARLLTPALQDQPSRRTQTPSPVETLEENATEAASRPQAA
jgi:hypothetical protein